jgi:hypothetical protein
MSLVREQAWLVRPPPSWSSSVVLVPLENGATTHRLGGHRMSRLDLVTECEHGNEDCLMTVSCRHSDQSYDHSDWQTSWKCPGGSRIRLDPDRRMVIEDKEFGEVVAHITVQDVLDALGIDSEDTDA